MSICCFRNGSFCESFEEATAGPVPAAIFHLSTDGKAERLQERPQLEMEEGLLLVAGEFYVDPLEMEVEFLKAADARQWLEALLLRHVERVRSVGEDLFVLAQIGEVEA